MFKANSSKVAQGYCQPNKDSIYYNLPLHTHDEDYFHLGTLRIDGYLTLVLLTHGELTAFHRLMKYGEPLSVRKAHPSMETYSYKCTGGLKTLLVEYLLMQNRYLTGEERNPKTSKEWKEANGGIPLLTDLCLAMRSDPVRMIRGLGEVVTCIYGPAVTYAFSDTLMVAC